ncbi:MAG: hypothetical protein JWM53_6826 [bacterium]|nr:hypothetical protein [bacterium]
MYCVLPETRIGMLILIVSEVFRIAAPYLGTLLLAASLGRGPRNTLLPA